MWPVLSKGTQSRTEQKTLEKGSWPNISFFFFFTFSLSLRSKLPNDYVSLLKSNISVNPLILKQILCYGNTANCYQKNNVWWCFFPQIFLLLGSYSQLQINPPHFEVLTLFLFFSFFFYNIFHWIDYAMLVYTQCLGFRLWVPIDSTDHKLTVTECVITDTITSIYIGLNRFLA